MYFSGRPHEFFEDPKHYGLMLSYRMPGRYKQALNAGCHWFLDNGAFSKRFVEKEWMRNLERLLPWKANCKAVILPDHVIFDAVGVFAGGDWEKTLKKSERYAPIVQSFGYPIAYVLQNWHDPERLPWHLLDVLFIGGANEYRYTRQVQEICFEAKRRGKWIHYGRVSSAKNIRKSWYADSWDSTTFLWEAEKKRTMINMAIREVGSTYNRLSLL